MSYEDDPVVEKAERRYGLVAGIATHLVELWGDDAVSAEYAARCIGNHLSNRGLLIPTRVARLVALEGDDPAVERCQGGCGDWPNCITDHHECFPASNYRQDPVALAYRELLDNRRFVCERRHRELHHYTYGEAPPEMPPRREMAEEVVSGWLDASPDLEDELRRRLFPD